jgi:hypothetical protein
MELPSILAARRIDDRWWLMAPSHDPIERAPICIPARNVCVKRVLCGCRSEGEGLYIKLLPCYQNC